MNNPINTNYLSAMGAVARDADNNAQNAWLSDYRQRQISALENATFPTQKVEHFKYNHLDIFEHHDFNRLAPTSSSSLNLSTRPIAGLDAIEGVERIVFVNGHFSPSLSQFSQHKITDLNDTNAEQQEKILAQLSAQTSIAHNPFTQVNAGLCDNGVLIEMDEESPSAPLEILNIIDADIANTTLASQVFIDVAARSKATIISRSLSWDLAGAKRNVSTQQTLVNVGESAHFTHYALQLENAASVVFAASEYNLQSNATLKAFYGATGTVLKKLDITVNHLGQYAHAFLNGLYAATDKQQIDYHTTINHPLPNGQTDEIFRGIVNGESEATFNGRIHIFEDAQKTRAELSNKNLILSDNAQIHTKPELEIYADDVVCAHGATVSRMNDESLNYMRARAIAKDEAELMLSYGFFNEVLDELEDDYIADYIRPILFERFG